jgi:hypothetical protein
MKRTKLKRKSKSPTAILQQKLVEVSHTYIRLRDSINPDEIRGYCFDCGTYTEGRHFQAGHFIADASGGAILRYHPHNMHGQASGCNMKVSQERVKIEYTIKMQEKYGIDYVNFLRSLKNKSIKADEIFYRKMIELYEKGDEDSIVQYLHGLLDFNTPPEAL